eukprot:3451687-Amphidinium_carterae.1
MLDFFMCLSGSLCTSSKSCWGGIQFCDGIEAKKAQSHVHPILADSALGVIVLNQSNTLTQRSSHSSEY